MNRAREHRRELEALDQDLLAPLDAAQTAAMQDALRTLSTAHGLPAGRAPAG